MSLFDIDVGQAGIVEGGLGTLPEVQGMDVSRSAQEKERLRVHGCLGRELSRGQERISEKGRKALRTRGGFCVSGEQQRGGRRKRAAFCFLRADHNGCHASTFSAQLHSRNTVVFERNSKHAFALQSARAFALCATALDLSAAQGLADNIVIHNPGFEIERTGCCWQLARLHNSSH